MIIDAHTHIFPDKIAAAATKATAVFYSTSRTPLHPDVAQMSRGTGTADDLDRALKEAGIDRCLVFSAATAARQVESINSFIASACQAHPNWYGAGTMHVEYTNFEGECDRLLSLGLKGIKLHPDIQKFSADDPRLLPLYEIMSDKHLFLILHAGDNRFDYSGPAKLAALAKNFPRLRMICAHFAGWSQWDEAREIMKLDNVYMDTSSTIGFAGPETAKKAFGVFDNSHIFFGSDFPMWDPKEELDTILRLGLRDDVLDGVLHANFENFLTNL